VAEIGGNPDADALAARVVAGLHTWYSRFVASGGDARRCGAHEAYREQCVTLDREVEVFAPDGVWQGHATDIDAQGRLLVRDPQSRVRAVSAADVSLKG